MLQGIIHINYETRRNECGVFFIHEAERGVMRDSIVISTYLATQSLSIRIGAVLLSMHSWAPKSEKYDVEDE